MKKKIIIGVIGALVILFLGCILFFIFGLQPVNKKDTKEVTFSINAGDSKLDIASYLKEASLIRNKTAVIGYMFFKGNLNLQAGEYTLSKSMSAKEILNKFDKGDIKTDVKSIDVTFVEGKRITDYAKVISDNFGYTEDEIINTINSKDFLTKMVEKYWFLTDDVLNDKIYYGLEGYILPDTYNFMNNYSIEDIFITLLNNTDSKLNNFKKNIEDSDYSIHEILTIASIAELEANSKSDRQSVTQVIYKRLSMNMSLGMDVTTYYASRKQMGEELTYKELVDGNDYNTRNTNFIGLPIGPICNPSADSIEAVFTPSNTNYLYFYADITTGKVYFAQTSSEFYEISQKYKVD